MTKETQNGEESEDRFTVLEVFGLKLEVSNPRLADLLTLDAGEAVSKDIRDLGTPEAAREVAAEVREGAPDMVIHPTTPKDEQDEKNRRELRDSAFSLGEQMGFSVHTDGVWESPTGIVILTRVIDRALSFAGASHFVEEVSSHREKLSGRDSTVLFIAPDQQTADVLKVAIRQARLYDMMRTISLENLIDIASMFESLTIDHNQAIVLLAPIADIDVGEILAVIHSATDPREEAPE